jgi:hypothetical protein
MQWNFTWDVVSDSHHFNLCFAAVNSCYDIVNVLREKGYIAQVKDSKNCVIFDDGAYKRDQKPMNARIQQFCGVSQRIDTMRRLVLFFHGTSQLLLLGQPFSEQRSIVLQQRNGRTRYFTLPYLIKR